MMDFLYAFLQLLVVDGRIDPFLGKVAFAQRLGIVVAKLHGFPAMQVI